MWTNTFTVFPTTQMGRMTTQTQHSETRSPKASPLTYYVDGWCSLTQDGGSLEEVFSHEEPVTERKNGVMESVAGLMHTSGVFVDQTTQLLAILWGLVRFGQICQCCIACLYWGRPDLSPFCLCSTNLPTKAMKPAQQTIQPIHYHVTPAKLLCRDFCIPPTFRNVNSFIHTSLFV